MLNSLIGYEEEYSIILLTAANLSSDTYMAADAVSRILKRTKAIALWPRFIQPLRNLVSSLKRSESRENAAAKINDELINTGTSRSIRAVFFLRSLMLALAGIFAMLWHRPHVVCIYEINGMLAARVLRRFFPKIYIFGKFQGTVLGENLNSRDFFSTSLLRHPFDAAAFQHINVLDGVIMTNDGTRGQEVLEKFGFSNEKILFLPNGVDERFISAARSLNEKFDFSIQKDGVLKTISLSRLIGWKRVDRILEAIAILEKNDSRKIFHTIIGDGSEADRASIFGVIDANSISHLVDFKAGQSIENVISALSTADLLISVYKPTNVANPVFEALAMTVPVLTIRDETLINVLGERARGCFFIDEPGSENLPQVLSRALEGIDHVAIREKKEILRKLEAPSWRERSFKELRFIDK